MEIALDKRLFWFLKEDAKLDLSKPHILDMYIQQVLTYGRAEDIRALFKKIPMKDFKQVFARLKSFLPKEVRQFWEDFIGNT